MSHGQHYHDFDRLLLAKEFRLHNGYHEIETYNQCKCGAINYQIFPTTHISGKEITTK